MAQVLRLRALPRGALSTIPAILLLVLALPGPGCAAPADPGAIDRAFAEMAEDVPVEGEGEVVKLLRDDMRGSWHQRFIIRIPSGLTLLVAHNIDVGRRVPLRGPGDRVRFRGDYEWNDKGGVVHWTHHDPGGRHRGGWIEFEGERYD